MASTPAMAHRTFCFGIGLVLATGLAVLGARLTSANIHPLSAEFPAIFA
jgi:hypothetical protein